VSSGLDRRGLNLGIALIAIGGYFLLRRELHWRGPGPLLLLIGTVLFVAAALRDFQGPIVPAGVLLGLGAGFLLRDPLLPWMPPWATLLLGLGAGLLFAAAIERSRATLRRPAPLLPGAVLVAIAAVTAISRNLVVPEELLEYAWRLWPWALVVAGVALMVQAMRRRKAD
jgi:drug/metabolite transporter (DMT)-like permease